MISLLDEEPEISLPILLGADIPEEDLGKARSTIQHLIQMNEEHKRRLEKLLIRIQQEDWCLLNKI